jgi:hypothetical protein
VGAIAPIAVVWLYVTRPHTLQSFALPGGALVVYLTLPIVIHRLKDEVGLGG